MPIYVLKNDQTKLVGETQMKENNEKKAEKQYWSGSLRASVWKNEGKDDKGNVNEFLSAKVYKAYKDKLGKWQETTSYNISDLPHLSLLAQKIYMDFGIHFKE
jgi:hypothetical protein